MDRRGTALTTSPPQIWAFSSAGQSIRLITGRSRVQAPEGPPGGSSTPLFMFPFYHISGDHKILTVAAAPVQFWLVKLGSQETLRSLIVQEEPDSPISLMKEVTAIHISYSRMASYLRCPYQHWLRYVARLEKKKPERPLYFGTDFHKLLELRNDKAALKRAKEDIKDAYYGMPAAWQAALGEDYVDDLFSIFKDYQSIYAGTRQPQITEKEFELDVGSCKGEPIIFVGKIDELYLLKRQGVKHIIVGEHKTFSYKPTLDTLIMNPQKCLYAKAVYFLKGILPGKVKWDYIKSTPAAEPIWLEKSGRFSEAASTKITPMSWARACKSHGITSKEVLEKGERYRGNIPEFFFQVELDIDPDMVDSVWDGFLYTARQIIRCGERNKTHNLTRDCSWCSYHDICYAEMTGGDASYVIQRDFQERQKE